MRRLDLVVALAVAALGAVALGGVVLVGRLGSGADVTPSTGYEDAALDSSRAFLDAYEANTGLIFAALDRIRAREAEYEASKRAELRAYHERRLAEVG